MDQHRIDTLTRSVSGLRSRRTVLAGLAAAGLGWGVARLPGPAEAKKQRKRKQGVCQKNGSPCKKPGKKCRNQFCLRAPFTIEARWTEPADHDTYLFVPPENEATGPTPYIHYTCRQDNSRCEVDYPFACSSDDNDTPGAEVTTIFQLLQGTYEYWIELDDIMSAAGAVAVVLRDDDGRVVRRWASPANETQVRVSWHVFDVDGRHGCVTAIDALIDDRLPDSAHDPNTDVCPD